MFATSDAELAGVASDPDSPREPYWLTRHQLCPEGGDGVVTAMVPEPNRARTIYEPEPEPYECCGLPVTGQRGHRYDDAPPEDGRHWPTEDSRLWPTCRTDLRQQPMTLRQALFGRHA
ncbi:hypothetical protein [Streptomyces sp. NPDC058694]|uniref:hypothetical protein n=1 Tax=Streptomyces sp. NPDC058694 TaxID=3346603 RepID=UPI00365D5C6D